MWKSYNVMDVAGRFLLLDEYTDGRSLFARDEEGLTRLTGYLHLSQIMYIAKTGGYALYGDDLHYIDGKVVVPGLTWEREYSLGGNLPFRKDVFVSEMYWFLKDAPTESVVEMSHEDPSLEMLTVFKDMDKDPETGAYILHYEYLEFFTPEYKKQYKDALRIIRGRS